MEFVPARTSLRPRDYRRRRSSLPLHPSAAALRRTPNTVPLQLDSSQVISSLISTLSAISPHPTTQSISSPTLASSRSTPSSPSPHATLSSDLNVSRYVTHNSTPSSPTRGGFSMDYGTLEYLPQAKEDRFLRPYEAAIAPVVRTSKLFPSAVPPTSSKQDSWRRCLQSNLKESQAQSERHLRQCRSYDERYAEASSTPSTMTIPSGGGRNRNGFEECELPSLKISQEKVRERKPEKTRVVELVESNSCIGNESVFARPTSEFIPRGTIPHDNLLRPAVCVLKDQCLENVGHQIEGHVAMGLVTSKKKIPTRDSSKRHSLGVSKTHKRKSHIGNEEKVEDRAGDQPEPHNCIPLAAAKFPDNLEDDEVSRRIKELKDQKMRRNRISALDSEALQSQPRTMPSGEMSQSSPRPSNAVLETERNGLRFVINEQPQAGGVHAASLAATREKGKKSGTCVSSLAFKVSPSQAQALESPTTFQLTNPFTPSRSASRPHKRTFSSQPLLSRSVSMVENRPKSTDSTDLAVEDYIYAPRLSQNIRHIQTGRNISFSEVGDPNGLAVFCCVGMGLTRYVTAFYDELASTLQLRLITPDRPGVGESEVHLDGSDTPLGWPDDVLAICQHLKITKFALLAHSAGAIYALATALRMPQHIRGRIHLLAPWIPPSQLSHPGLHDPLPSTSLPYSQRILRSLPTPFLRVANSNFLSATSASITTSLPRSPRRSKRKSLTHSISSPSGADSPKRLDGSRRASYASWQGNSDAEISFAKALSDPTCTNVESAVKAADYSEKVNKERRAIYESRLTDAIWDVATRRSNPAVDLLVCLERRQTIGFRYVDITKPVVVHHGSKDSRVPLENVIWLSKAMRRCEVRVLEGEGHGLMASARVMGNVLTEISHEWRDWMTLVQGKAQVKGERR